jgi:Raf kinase inhibitor-like YbhB/YbcL family protein
MRRTEHAREKSRRVVALGLARLFLLILVSCRKGDPDMARITQTEIAQIDVTSPAFPDGGMIPQQYTCEGADVSPPLNWGPVPDGTRSIALIVDDPDAPVETFVQWVLYDLPADVQGLPEDLPGDKTFPVGGEQGINSSDELGYRGPCPPSGTHRYFFKVYALDIKTNLPPGETKERLLEAMNGHVLAQGQIMGRYRRQQ